MYQNAMEMAQFMEKVFLLLYGQGEDSGIHFQLIFQRALEAEQQRMLSGPHPDRYGSGL